MSLGIRGMAGGGKGYMSFTKQFSDATEAAGPYTFSYDIENVHYISMRARLVSLTSPIELNGRWVYSINCDVEKNELTTEYLSSTSNSTNSEHRKTRMDGQSYNPSSWAPGWSDDSYAARVSVNTSAKTITITQGSNTPPFLYNGLKSSANKLEYLITVC